MIGWAIFLFFAGMVLIIAEFLLPGGILGTIGFGMLIGSTVAAGVAFSWAPIPTFFIILIEVCGAITSMVIGLYLLTRTSMGKGLRLETTQSVDDGYIDTPSDLKLVGETGRVLTALRPSGTIQVGDKRIDAVSDGTFISENEQVRIIEVHGNRVVVEPASGEETSE